MILAPEQVREVLVVGVLGRRGARRIETQQLAARVRSLGLDEWRRGQRGLHLVGVLTWLIVRLLRLFSRAGISLLPTLLVLQLLNPCFQVGDLRQGQGWLAIGSWLLLIIRRFLLGRVPLRYLGAL